MNYVHVKTKTSVTFTVKAVKHATMDASTWQSLYGQNKTKTYRLHTSWQLHCNCLHNVSPVIALHHLKYKLGIQGNISNLHPLQRKQHQSTWIKFKIIQNADGDTHLQYQMYVLHW